MDDAIFISKVNDVSRENGLALPSLKPGELPSTAFLSEWAEFLEGCVRKGITLSDKRWERLAVKARSPHTVFVLEGPAEERTDSDFRVGLQLLMGLLESQDSAD